MTGVQTCALRSEEHTSELQSHDNIVCRLLLEKKKNVQATRTRRPRGQDGIAARHMVCRPLSNFTPAVVEQLPPGPGLEAGSGIGFLMIRRRSGVIAVDCAGGRAS